MLDWSQCSNSTDLRISFSFVQVKVLASNLKRCISHNENIFHVSSSASFHDSPYALITLHCIQQLTCVKVIACNMCKRKGTGLTRISNPNIND